MATIRLLALRFPFEGSRVRRGAYPASLPGAAASHGIGCAPESSSGDGVSIIGFSSPALASSLFDPPSRAFPVPPDLYRSSSLALGLPFRVLRVCLPARNAGAFLGVPSLIATSAGASTCREHPNLTAFRPRRFSRPRRLSPIPASRVCFTPLPRPGFTLRGLPRRTAARAFARRYPPVVGTIALQRCSAAPGSDPSPSGSCSVLRSVAAVVDSTLPLVPSLRFSFLGSF